MNLATFIFASVSLAIQFYAVKYREEDVAQTLIELQNDFGVPRIETFEFIVVGAGTAGSVVAGRLSRRYKVLLLEAGGTPPPPTEVPSYYANVHGAPDINYFFESVPQLQANGKVFTRISLGKMLGGSGAHNGMVHNRGSPHDFDNWAALLDDESWTYENVLQYFKKGEKFVGTLFAEGDEDKYGYDGEMGVDTQLGPLIPIWAEAAAELGYRFGDPNGNQTESFTPNHKSVDKRGRRVTSYNAIIQPNEGNPDSNLTVIRYADVEEILWLMDDATGQWAATGVQYIRHGLTQRATASKEVIVSCGAYRSPLLLMKSGVGPASMLEEAGIRVRVDRPGVGSNLTDHVGVRILPFHLNATLYPEIQDGDEAEVLDKYRETGEGPLNAVSPAQVLLVSKRARAAGEPDWPDIRLNAVREPDGYDPREQQAMKINVMAGRPKSRGNVALNTTAYRAGVRDDTELALIDFNMFADQSDMDPLVDGIQFALKIMEETAAFQRLGATYTAVSHPLCIQHLFRSVEYWKCFIRNTVHIHSHITGTCSMGRLTERMAVVDSQLRVIGVKGLRVIDSSVMPSVPNANINAPVLMVAEKGADEILKYYNQITD